LATEASGLEALDDGRRCALDDRAVVAIQERIRAPRAVLVRHELPAIVGMDHCDASALGRASLLRSGGGVMH